MIVILLITMNDILNRTLLQLLLLSIVFFSSCGTTHRVANSSNDYTKNYSKEKSRKSVSRSYSSKNSKRSAVTHNKASVRSRNSKSKSTRRHNSVLSNTELAKRESMVSYANNLQGIPYLYGGKNKNGFDCSGFISHVFANQDVIIKGNSNHQATLGQQISIQNAREGDLIFFGKGKRISHVALVVYQDQQYLKVIHCTSSKGVILQDIKHSDYWKSRMLFARDVLGSVPLAD